MFGLTQEKFDKLQEQDKLKDYVSFELPTEKQVPYEELYIMDFRNEQEHNVVKDCVDKVFAIEVKDTRNGQVYIVKFGICNSKEPTVNMQGDHFFDLFKQGMESARAEAQMIATYNRLVLHYGGNAKSKENNDTKKEPKKKTVAK